MKFNPADGKFKCEYCDSVYEEDYLKTLDDKDFDDLKKSDKAEDYGKAEDGAQNVYTCKSCGAELVTDETTAATTCYYCHNPIVLTGRLAADMKPDGLIPFGVEEKAAKKRLTEWMSKKRYVPRDFISERSISNISGIYYPYWLADYEVDAQFEGEGTKVTHSSDAKFDITKTDYYRVTRAGKIKFRNVYRGALKKADRKLSDGIHPFNDEKLIDFEPSYLSGFMAEKRDVEAADIKDDVEREVEGYIQPVLTSDVNYDSLSGSSKMRVLDSKYKYELLPAWVLTYKGGDGKMYYYSLNGQNGEQVCGILPMDKKKLLIDSILVGGLVALIAGLIAFLII